MKKGSTLILRGVLVLIGLAVLSILVFGVPRVIGTFQMGGYDPILLGLYVTAVPFYVALFRSMQILNYIDRGNAFSDNSVLALKSIKHCGITISILFLAGLPYIFKVADQDDAPGVVLIALIIIFTSLVVATFAALLQKLLRNAIDMKSEIDLTV